jgi:CRP-like cAMP-binding protein
MRLRRFLQNQVICRLGEEDCTAFYILKCEDLDELSNFPQRILADKTRLEIQLTEASKSPKQLKELKEKLAGLERVLEKFPELTQCVEALRIPRQQLAILGLAPQAEHEAAPPTGPAAWQESMTPLLSALQAGDQANRQLTEMEQQAVTAGQTQRAALLAELRRTDPAKKRERAAQLDGQDAALAGLLRASAQAADLRTAAIAYLPKPAPPTEAQPEGLLQRLKRSLFGAPARAGVQPPSYIPFDGPTGISARTRQASMNEGELLGEMACLNRAPRSATVVAARDCYVLEMLSNVLTEIDKDPDYQKERSRVYVERVLDLHLRDLSIFRDLTDEQFGEVFATVRSRVELKAYVSGELICDEHERSDCVYLVRSGLVQVKKNVTSLLSVADVCGWADLCVALGGDAGPAAAVAQLLPGEIRTLLKGVQDPERLTAGDRAAIVDRLNEVIKNRQLSIRDELRDLVS